MNLKEELHRAGTVFDGHVTNGSLEAQVQVVNEWLDDFVQEVKNQLKVAGDFGKFEEHEINEEALLPEYVAIEIMKKVKESYGIATT